MAQEWCNEKVWLIPSGGHSMSKGGKNSGSYYKEWRFYLWKTSDKVSGQSNWINYLKKNSSDNDGENKNDDNVRKRPQIH